MKHLAWLIALSLLLAACGAPVGETPPEPALETVFPRGGVTQGLVYFYAPEQPVSRYALPDGSLAAVLDALCAAAPLEADALPMDAAQAALCLELEAQDGRRAQCLISSLSDDIDVYIIDGGERRIIRLSAPGLRNMLTAFEADALIQYAHTPETAPPDINPALRAALPDDALTVSAEAAVTEHRDYTPQDTPFYRVLSADDSDIAIAEDQLLIVAAYGQRATDGYAIRIDAVETNATFARVRVTVTTPAEGDWVQPTPVSPVDSVVVNADAIPSDSTVAFYDQNGALLYLQEW